MKKKLLAGMSLAVIILGIVLFINTKDAAIEAPVVDDVATVETVVEEIPEEEVPEEITEVEAPVEESVEEITEVEVVENTAPSFLTQEYANQVQEERDRQEWLADRKARNEKIREQIANNGETVEESVEEIEETVAASEEVVVEAPVEVIQPSGNASSTSFTPIIPNDYDFSTNPTLIELKKELDAYIHADAGGGNEHTGLVLGKNYAAITWTGLYGAKELEVYYSNGNVAVDIRCNLDDRLWNSLTVIMNQIYSNGTELVELMKDDMYNGRNDVYNFYNTPDMNYIGTSDFAYYGDIQTNVTVFDDLITYMFKKN